MERFYEEVNVDEASRQTGTYYDEVGWKTVDDGRTIDRATWVDDRACAKDYLDRYYARVRDLVPPKGSAMLDVGCGPLEDLRYVALSDGYAERYCVDLSKEALYRAGVKIGLRGRYYLSDFLDVDLEDDRFDCVLCSHSLYHVHKDRQSEMVRKMLRVAKPGAPVLVAYKHGLSLLDIVPPVVGFLARFKTAEDARRPYAYTHSRGWWGQFEDEATVEILPLQTFDVCEQRGLFPDDEVGRMGLAMLSGLEDRFPDFFSRLGKYCLVRLRKGGQR